MRMFLMLFAVWLSSAAAAAAQEAPNGEIFVGYSHEIADISRSRLDLNGFHLSVAENLNSWFGGLLDFSAHFTNVNGNVVDTETVTFGPQFAYRKLQSLVPSAHVALGVVRGSPGFLGNSISGTHFGLIGGGSLDYKMHRNAAIRIIQADFMRTKFQDLTRNNVRLSAGLVLYIRYR